MRVVVNVLEVNRVRFVALEGITLALAEAIDAGDRETDGAELDPARELRRALSSLLAQPLPEVKMDATTELEVELLAPAHELEQLADELEEVQDAGELEQIVGRLRRRAAARA